MADYEGNSFRSRQEKTETPPQVSPVVTNPGKTVKKSFLDKALNVLFNTDIKDIKTHIIKDVIIPSVKSTLANMLHSSTDMFIYGNTQTRASGIANVGFTDYNKMSSGNRFSTTAISDPGATSSIFDNVVLRTREDAARVLDAACDYLASYNTITVSVLYDLAQIKCDNYLASNFGWKNLSTARIVSTPRGWEIVMPKAMPIN